MKYLPDFEVINVVWTDLFNNDVMTTYVTDGTSGIEDATVILSGAAPSDGWWGSSYTTGYERETTTDADGNYSFSGLPDESFTVHVTADGYYSSRGIDSAVELTAINDDNLKYVRVLDGDGNTLRDAEVMLYEAHTTTWTSAQKLGAATHVVRPSAESNYNYIFAFHQNYATGVIVPDDSVDANLEISLEPSSTAT